MMSAHALLLTDVVDSTRLVERLGDARSAELWTEHDRRARDLMTQHGGREVDRTDGFFLLFDDVADAARYALAYHAQMAEIALGARIGLHVGDVTLRENAAADVARGAKRVEVEGVAKPFAARVMALAGAGQTLLSASARAALGETALAGTGIESHGHYRLKGVEDPVELFELGILGRCAFAPPKDADKAYRVVRAGEFWRPVREVRHNLPAERDAFIGRTAELHALAQRLDAGTRLLTVLGPGGTGKTRFVRRYGWAWLGDWPGGVYFCDLSEARSLDGILFAIAVALDVPLGKGDPVVQLGHAIAGRGRCLVVLDNFEQVIEHAQSTLAPWLDRAGDAAFVVTSRERLHLPGEEILALEPLPVAGEAVELFAVRARAQRADFVLSEANRSAVAEVVRLLDGLPLAIELAAARVRVLSPAQLVERMRDRFKLLAGAHGPAARQATLRAAIDWSWDLLMPWEQAALAQCSVFEGGFALEAAEAVLDLSSWSDAPSTMDAVQALVDKSLLRTWPASEPGRFDLDEPYFGMYLSIHEYAAEKLDVERAATRSAQERHGLYFSRFGADDAIEALFRHGCVSRRRQLALDLDNFVAACHRAVGRNDSEVAVMVYRAAWEVLESKGPFSLGAILGAQVLSLDGLVPSLRAVALLTRARSSRRAGRMEEAGVWIAQALALYLSMRDRRREGVVMGTLGDLRREQGRMQEAREHLVVALDICREVGDRRAEGVVHDNLGNLHKEQGWLEEARGHYELALALHRELGNRRAEGIVLGNLGLLHFEQGRMEVARAHYDQALAVHQQVGNRLDADLVLGNLGNLLFEMGRFDEAEAQYNAVLAGHRELGNRRGEGIVLGNLGNLHHERDSLEEASAHYDASIAVHREVGNRRSEGIMLCNLGLLRRKQGRMDEAAANIGQALSIQCAMGNRFHEGVARGCMGEVLTGQGRIAEAREAFRAGEVLLREVGDPLELAKLLCGRGHADIAAGQHDAAHAALTEAQASAVALSAGPDSELGRECATLRQALAATHQTVERT